MAVRVIAAIISAVTCIAFAVALLFVMLVVMNGYAESDATWGLALFAVLVLLITAAMAATAWYIAAILTKKGWNSVTCVLLAAILAIVGGLALEIVASTAGVALAELIRVKF